MRINIQDIKMTGRYFFSVILLICVATAAAQQSCSRCLYTFVTKTGNQSAEATLGAEVDLIFNFTDRSDNISNISRYSVEALMGTPSESFQNETLDAFLFYGPCEQTCDAAIVFRGLPTNYWQLDFFTLGACLPTTGCDLLVGYRVNGKATGPLSILPFNFCAGGVGTEKLKTDWIEASLLPLVDMPSYTI